MVTETSAARLPAPRPLRRLVWENLGWATLIFALLECWRPLYFLTDDNLDGAFPQLAGIGRRLIHGESPFVTDYLFGGHYNLLRDSSCICWHPLYIVAALLSNTPSGFVAIDFIALCFLWLAATGFVCLADFLRREYNLPLGDARLTFCAQSFTYSMIVLCTGSSWIDFLANHSALPWLALGILQARLRNGLALTTVFSLHQILGGHLGMMISCSLALTLFALGVACLRRSVVPLANWLGGSILAVLILSPILIPAAEGFLSTSRSQGLAEASIDQYAFPALLLPASFFFGVASWLFHFDYVFGYCSPVYSAAFASCAAAWLIIPALASRRRWTGLEILCALLVGWAVLLVIRPAWLGQIMTHIPLLRSLRWPFREILELQFFLHLLLILRPLGGPLLFQRLAAVLSLLIFAGPFYFLSAPTFCSMKLDRSLVLSGTSTRYWDQVRELLKPGEVIVPVVNPKLTHLELFNAPFSLIAAYNYPEYFQVKSGVGYYLTVPSDQAYFWTQPWVQGDPWNTGAFMPSQEAAIREERPNVRFVTLESVNPLRVTLSSPTGPIDLTPFLTR